MRKLFRMKYEPCVGQCYAYSDVMRIHTLGLDARGAAAFLRRLLAAHAPSCGDPGIEFRLDADEFTRSEYNGGDYKDVEDVRFVASFYHHGALDLFASDTPLGALDQLIDAALAYYETQAFKSLHDETLLRERVCEHGTDEKLVSFALAFSGLTPEAQAEVRAELARD